MNEQQIISDKLPKQEASSAKKGVREPPKEISEVFMQDHTGADGAGLEDAALHGEVEHPDQERTLEEYKGEYRQEAASKDE